MLSSDLFASSGSEEDAKMITASTEFSTLARDHSPLIICIDRQWLLRKVWPSTMWLRWGWTFWS